MPVVTLDDIARRSASPPVSRGESAAVVLSRFLQELSRDIGKELSLNENDECGFMYETIEYLLRAHPTEDLFSVACKVFDTNALRLPERRAAVDCALDFGYLSQKCRGAFVFMDSVGMIVLIYEDRPSDVTTQTLRNILENFIDVSKKLIDSIEHAVENVVPTGHEEALMRANAAPQAYDVEAGSDGITYLEDALRRMDIDYAKQHGTDDDIDHISSEEAARGDPTSTLMTAIQGDDPNEEDITPHRTRAPLEGGASRRVSGAHESLLSASDIPLDPRRLVASILRKGDVIDLATRNDKR